MNSEVTLLTVAQNSRVKRVAKSVATLVREEKPVALQATGNGAVSQAVNAVIIARELLEPYGIDIGFSPTYTDLVIDGKEITQVHLEISKRC